MAADKMKEILKHFPDLEEGWKEMEEKLKTEPAEREMLSLKYREMLQREELKENLPEPEFTKAKRAESDSKVMKANAPEKIYVADTTFPDYIDFDGSPINTKRIDDHDIEYTQTDAFIEKAEKWLDKTLRDTDFYENEIELFIKEFKKAMKL